MMFNVNSLSYSPETCTNALNNHTQLSSNQITGKIQRIHNVPTEPITIRNLPKLVIDEIGKYLDVRNIQNFNEADVSSEKIDPYTNQIKKLRQWEKECPKNTKENRKLALERIISCIRKEESILDLSYLNLTSLPNLRSLGFITKIIYEGNDDRPIQNCFYRDVFSGSMLKLKQPFLLPDSIQHIITDYDRVTRLVFTSNEYSLANFLTLEEEAHLNLHSYTWYKKVSNGNPYCVPEVQFIRMSYAFSYTNDFEKDFLHFYRL